MMTLMMTFFNISRMNKQKKLKAQFYDLETSLSELGIVDDDMFMIRRLINQYIDTNDDHCYMICKNMMFDKEKKYNLSK